MVKRHARDSKNSICKFYKDNSKLINIILAVMLLLIPMFYAGYARSYPYSLPIADDWASQNIEGNIKAQIGASVKAQYPNLPAEQQAKEVNTQYEAYYKLHKNEIKIESKKAADHFRSQFQADNGQTYLLAIDPYYYYVNSRNLYTNGHPGDSINEEGESIVDRRLAPVGTRVGNDFHTVIESKLYSLFGVSQDADAGEFFRAIYFLPLLFSILAIIPLFLILRTYTNDLFASLGGVFITTISTFLSRTMAGFVDTDAYNVFFPLLILLFVVLAVKSDSKWKVGVYAGLAGLSQTIYQWAWGSGWFSFLFIALALVGFSGFKIVSKLINKKNIFENDILGIAIATVSFIISAFITSLFVGKNIIATTFRAIFGSMSSIALISSTNIWPNVLSSVAELNPASFGQIISTVGGKLVFFISLFGLLLLACNFKAKEEKFSKYRNILMGLSFVWFGLFTLSFKEMGFLASLHNSLIGLTNNSPLVFIVLLFLPVFAGLVLALFNDYEKNSTFLSILLSIWIAGTIYMSFNGVRFILLLAPAFVIAFIVGLYRIAELANKYIYEVLDLSGNTMVKFIGTIAMLAVFLYVFIPGAKVAHQIGMNTVPNFDDQWYGLMDKINENSQPDAIISSWWDFGHFFIAASERGATFDGASQTTPRSHWIGRMLIENNETKSKDMLRMLVCGGNGAFDVMMDITNDTTGGILVNKVIYQTIGNENKREILKNNKYFTFTDVEIERIMEELSCNNPPENFIIASEDMVGKAGVWAHWGSWNFSRKYILDNYNGLSIDEISSNIDEPVDLVEELVLQLREIDMRALMQNIKRTDLVNQWLAPYPSYVPIEGRYWWPCQANEDAITCQNGVVVNRNDKSVQFSLGNGATVKNLVLSMDSNLEVFEQDSNGVFDAVIKKSGDSYQVMMTQSPLGASLFTKLFYLDGVGTTSFDKFDSRTTATGQKIYTWKVNWNEAEAEAEAEANNDSQTLKVDNLDINSSLSLENISVENES